MKRQWRLAISALWALIVAFLVDAVFSGRVAWWHPYCDSQADGPAAYGYGFPLPYRQWTGISSLEYDVMPHIYVLNLLLVALLVWPILWRIAGILPSRRWSLGAGVFGGLLILAALWLQLLAIQGWWPTWTIASSYDRYIDYRPTAFVSVREHRACETYP